jgi:hypothetical protein
MAVCRECYVLSGIGLCGELITCPEESYRLWRVGVCSRDVVNEEATARVGPQRHVKKGRKRKSSRALYVYCVS